MGVGEIWQRRHCKSHRYVLKKIDSGFIITNKEGAHIPITIWGLNMHYQFVSYTPLNDSAEIRKYLLILDKLV